MQPVSLLIVSSGVPSTHPLPDRGAVTIGRGGDIELDEDARATVDVGPPVTIAIAAAPPRALAVGEPVQLGGSVLLLVAPAAPDTLVDVVSPFASEGLKGELRDIEKRRILDALEEHAGNQTLAARALGISRRTLLNRLDEYGIPRPRKRPR